MALRKVETGREGTSPPVPAPHARLLGSNRKSRRQLVRWCLLAAGPMLVAVVVGWFWITGGRYVSTDNAYVQADTVDVATDVAGLVKSIEVQDNEHVTRGQVLFTLDDATYRSALASAEADVKLAATQLEAMRASYAQSEAEIVKAKSDVAYFEREYQRQQELATRRVNAQMQLDAARHNLDAARGQLASLIEEQAGIAAQLGGDPAAPIERHPRYLAAVAARDRAAPRSRQHRRPGSDRRHRRACRRCSRASIWLPGQSAFALVATRPCLDRGQPQGDRSDLGPAGPAGDRHGRHLSRPASGAGTVASVSPASQSQFSMLPAQNTSGNWVKVVQRIPVRVAVEPEAGEPPLRAGMSAEIEVDTGHRRRLGDLFAWLVTAAHAMAASRSTPHAPSYGRSRSA